MSLETPHLAPLPSAPEHLLVLGFFVVHRESGSAIGSARS
jgi:hypothetical protein